MSHLDWQGRHAGATVWVLGSGATLDHVDRRMIGPVTVAVNHVALELGIKVPFVATNHHGMAQEVAEQMPDTVVVTPEVEQVAPEHACPVRPTAENVVFVPTSQQKFSGWDAAVDWPEDRTVLPLGPSSVQLALGWAEFIGAAGILLAGVDCARIDGTKNVSGHRNYPDQHFHPDLWRRALEGSAAVLRARGVAVHSLNPWVTLHLEGHRLSE